jgi:hypothetical membrane protein
MRHKLVNTLLICGIIYPLLYILADLIGSLVYPGYSYIDQTISELSAIGAPTAHYWVAMSFVFNPLLIAFGIGVLKASVKKRLLRILGTLITIWGLIGFVWLFFPMNMRGNIGSVNDTGHLVMAAITVLLMTAIVAVGSGAFGRYFRIYSIITILLMLSFGAFAGMQAPSVASQLPTPGLGIIERVSVFSPMIWILVLATNLLHIQKDDN